MKINLKELAVFSVLGAFMYISMLVLKPLPNIHILAPLIGAYTLTFRQKAFYPIAVFVFLTGLFDGFSMWWIPYLYVWFILWAVFLALPRFENRVVATLVYMLTGALHGLLFGVLYAPWQMIWLGLDREEIIAWIIAGLPFDVTHAIGNFLGSILILPLHKALKVALRQ